MGRTNRSATRVGTGRTKEKTTVEERQEQHEQRQEENQKEERKEQRRRRIRLFGGRGRKKGSDGEGTPLRRRDGTLETEGVQPGQRSHGNERSSDDTRIKIRDNYGFVVGSAYVGLYRQYAEIWEEEESRRRSAWSLWLREISGGTEDEGLVLLERALSSYGMDGVPYQDSERQREREEMAMLLENMRGKVALGLPMHLRSRLWGMFLDFEAVKEEGLYDAYVAYVEQCSRGATDACDSAITRMRPEKLVEWLNQIDKDLHRTFPDHFTMDEAGRAALRRLLGSFALRQPEVGYCQGLNFIAAAFLLFFDEESAFWCFAVMVEQILSGYFDPLMIASQVDGLAFAHLLKGAHTPVSDHFDHMSVDVPTAISGWFLVAYMNSLPFETCIRVWDVLFFEKSPVVLFRVGLALIDIYSEALLETKENGDVYMTLQALAPMTFDSTKLVETACTKYAHVKDNALLILRDKYAPSVTSIMESMFHIQDSHHHSPITVPSGCPKAPVSRSGSIAQVVNRLKLENEENITSNATLTSLPGFPTPPGIISLHEKVMLDDAVLQQYTGLKDVEESEEASMSQKIVRRTQSAVVPRAVEQAVDMPGLDERVIQQQQKRRISLLNSSTFVPNLKLPAVATAFEIATNQIKRRTVSDEVDWSKDLQITSDINTTQTYGNAIRDSGVTCHLSAAKTKSVMGEYRESQTMDVGSLIEAAKKLDFDHMESPQSSPVRRRFTDGGALLASLKNKKAPQSDFPVKKKESPLKVHIMSKIDMYEKKQLEGIASRLEVEVHDAFENLKRIADNRSELKKTVDDLNGQLTKIQREVAHTAMLVNVLHQRAKTLDTHIEATENEYRRQLYINSQHVDEWRAIQKEVTANATILQELMTLTQQSTKQPDSPIKAFRAKISTLTRRTFTDS